MINHKNQIYVYVINMKILQNLKIKYQKYPNIIVNISINIEINNNNNNMIIKYKIIWKIFRVKIIYKIVN